MIGYLDDFLRPLVLKLPKMGGCVKILKVKNKNRIDDDKLLEKYKAVWTSETEDLKNIELNALPVSNDRYIKNKIWTYVDKIYTNFHGLYVPEDEIECESFTVTSIDYLLVYKKI